MKISTILAVGSGGFIGAVLRFYVVSLFESRVNTIPYGVLSVNLIGSFLIGIFIAIFLESSVHPNIKLFLVTGLLGALTTYSTFAIETYFLLKSNLSVALINMVLNLFGSIFFAALGFNIVKRFI